MKRVYRKASLFDARRLGFAAFTLFVAYVAYRILTPPEQELVRVASPDGGRTARLRRFYYTSAPSYKIYYRDTGKRAWLNLLYLPSITNAPPDAAASIQWSPDSRILYFKLDGKTLWYHDFARDPAAAHR